MKKQGGSLWMIVGLVLVVAVVASVISSGITANVIKVQKTILGTQVYTKAEMDSKMRSQQSQADELNQTILYINSHYTTNEEVLRKLNKCQGVKGDGEGLPPSYNCDMVCNQYDKGICTIGFILNAKENPISAAPVECDESYNELSNESKAYLACMCC